MKILQIISSLGNGGAEKFVVELSNKLSAGNDVILCSFKAIEDHMQFPKLLNPACNLISLNKKKGFDIVVYRQLYHLIRTERPNIIHFHLDATIKYILPFILFFPEVKFIHTLHSDVNEEKRKLFRQFMRFKFITKKIKLVCIASNLLKDFEKEFPGFKFHLIANGINELVITTAVNVVRAEIEKLKLNDQTTVLICVGRLDDNKNQELLMQVLNDLKDRNVIALVIGSDPSVDQIYMNKLLNIKPNNVFILGAKTNVGDYMANADAFIMTSINEGMPISVLEAFSQGLPVISTPAGGLKSLVQDAENGFMAKDTSKEEMKKAIELFLELDNEQGQKMRRLNKEKFTSLYSMDTCGNNYLSLYNN